MRRFLNDIIRKTALINFFVWNTPTFWAYVALWISVLWKLRKKLFWLGFDGFPIGVKSVTSGLHPAFDPRSIVLLVVDGISTCSQFSYMLQQVRLVARASLICYDIFEDEGASRRQHCNTGGEGGPLNEGRRRNRLGDKRWRWNHRSFIRWLMQTGFMVWVADEDIRIAEKL